MGGGRGGASYLVPATNVAIVALIGNELHR